MKSNMCVYVCVCIYIYTYMHACKHTMVNVQAPPAEISAPMMCVSQKKQKFAVLLSASLY
jgi:hypothetical protein